jgi:hypothetical protein
VLRHNATTSSILVSACVLLVVFGARPAAAAPSLTEILEQHGLAVFEWHRLRQVNAKVGEQRLKSLRADSVKTVYANVGEFSRSPTSRTSGPASASSRVNSEGSWPAPRASAWR